MTTVSTSKVLMAVAGAILALGSLAGCSGSGSGGNETPNDGSGSGDSVEPAPVGGINGPARVDPDAVGVNEGESQD